MSTLENARRILAQDIAKQLFVNAWGDKGDRLQVRQMQDNGKERDLGGWCYNSAVDQIEDALKQSGH